MGARVAAGLRREGDEVRAVSRSTGVDVTTGAGLAEALEGADAVVDCLNVTTMSRQEAVGFFQGAAERVTRAAEQAGVAHLVVLSIVNVSDPTAQRLTGYYAGKAAQERAYAATSVPVSLVRTTAWFTLAEMFLSQLRLGRVAVVPAMALQPVHPEPVVELLTAVAHGQPPAAHQRLELAGPEVISAYEMARGLAQARGERVTTLPLPMPGRWGRVLLPGPQTPTDHRTYGAWLNDEVGRPAQT